MSQM